MRILIQPGWKMQRTNLIFLGRIGIIALLLMGNILSGCGQSSDSIVDETYNNALQSMSQEQPDTSAVLDDVTVPEPTASLESNGFLKGTTELNNEELDGMVTNLWYGKDCILMVNKESTLYLYDVQRGEIVQKKDIQVGDNAGVYPYNEGYCIIGDIGREKSLCVFYSEMMEETNRISLEGKIMDDPLFAVFAVSSDGSKLAFYDFWMGLNIYDIKTGELSKILDVDGDSSYGDNQKILDIDALYFDEDGKKLIFSAQTDYKGSTYESWGIINIDGSSLENHILDKKLGNAITYKYGKLIFGEDSLMFCKAMGYVDTKTGSQTYSTDIPTGNTVGGPEISKDGAYFGHTKLNDKNVEISIYKTEDFSLVYQVTIADDNEEYFYRIPKVYIFDELKVGVVCLGGHNDIPLKTILINFNE